MKWILHYFLLTYLWPTGVILPSVDNAVVYCPWKFSHGKRDMLNHHNALFHYSNVVVVKQ